MVKLRDDAIQRPLEDRRLSDRAREHAQVLRPWHLAGAKLRKVRSHPLRVEQLEGRRRAGCARARRARLSRHSSRGETSTLQKTRRRSRRRRARQPARLAPHLDRVRVPEFVQTYVALQNDVVDPCLGAFRAGAHDLRECRVHAHLPGRIAQRAPRAVRDVEIGNRQQPAPLRTEPADIARSTAIGNAPWRYAARSTSGGISIAIEMRSSILSR